MSSDHEVEWVVLRGPLPLEHRGPVDGGLLGMLVGRSKLLMRAGSLVLAIVGSGGFGSFLAIRSHYLSEGRAMEVRSREAQERVEIAARMKAIEAEVEDRMRALHDRMLRCEAALNLRSPP